MNPNQLSGSAAKEAWRALSPEQRKAAWAAAKTASAPQSVELAVVMAAYGNRWYQRLRWGALALPFVGLPLACVAGAALTLAGVEVTGALAQVVLYVVVGG